MIEEIFGRHAGFILASYAATVLVVVGLTLWILVERRVLKRQLTDMEARGHRRRSAARAAESREPIP